MIAMRNTGLYPKPPAVSSVDMTVSEYSDWLDDNITDNIYTLNKDHEDHEGCLSAALFTECMEKELKELSALPKYMIDHFTKLGHKPVDAPAPEGMYPDLRTFFEEL